MGTEGTSMREKIKAKWSLLKKPSLGTSPSKGSSAEDSPWNKDAMKSQIIYLCWNQFRGQLKLDWGGQLEWILQTMRIYPNWNFNNGISQNILIHSNWIYFRLNITLPHCGFSHRKKHKSRWFYMSCSILWSPVIRRQDIDEKTFYVVAAKKKYNLL